MRRMCDQTDVDNVKSYNFLLKNTDKLSRVVGEEFLLSIIIRGCPNLNINWLIIIVIYFLLYRRYIYKP